MIRNIMSNFLNPRVLTTNGIKNVSDVLIADQLYEYRTGELLDIIQTKKVLRTNCYLITFHDGRSEWYLENDQIFLGDRIINVCELLKQSFPISIEMYPIDYKKIMTPLFPDPYIAGALLMYGDFDDLYINLPLNRDKVNDHLFHKYNLIFGDKLNKNRVYFKSDRNGKEDLITWKEFFPNYKMYPTSKDINDPIIPIEYQLASINDRWKFIRGVFDLGYDQINFPDTIGISNKHEFRLKEIQKILWSLGVLSKISYDPNQTEKEMLYRLDILGEKNIYPGFFSNIYSMEYQINTDDRFIRHQTKYILGIQNIKYMGKYSSYRLKLNKQKTLYLSENFLPRVSL